VTASLREEKSGGGYPSFGATVVEESVVKKKTGRFGLGAIFDGGNSNKADDMDDVGSGATNTIAEAAAEAASKAPPKKAAAKIIVTEDTCLPTGTSFPILPNSDGVVKMPSLFVDIPLASLMASPLRKHLMAFLSIPSHWHKN
jgi:hypothetical protein